MAALSSSYNEGLLSVSDWLVPSLAALVSLVVAQKVYQKAFRRKKPWKKVPGAFPLVGHFPYIGGPQYMTQVLEDWADRYGTELGVFHINLAGVDYVVVCRADLAQQIFRQRPARVYRSAQIREGANSVGARGVFSAEGEPWKQEHKLVAAALNHGHVTDYMPILKDMSRRLTHKWLDIVQETKASSAVVAINNDLGSLTADSITRVMLDQDFDFLHYPDSKMATNVTKMLECGLVRALCPIWYWRIPWIGQYLDGYGWAVRSLWKTIETSVQQHEEGTDVVSSSTFLHKLVSIAKAEDSTLSRDRVVGNMVTLILAGTDTTYKLLTMALYVLATQPAMQEELRTHVDGFDWESASLEDLYTKLPYLKSFLHEVHRHYGFPFIMLEANADIPFMDTVLERGTNIIVLDRYLSTQRKNPSAAVPLGPDNAPPSDFNHRRYVEKVDDKATCPNPSTKEMAFLPFGQGARACPGRSYSEILSYCVLISLLQTFTFTLKANHPKVKILFDSVAMLPNKDIELELTPR
jgi:cytochrome P450